MSRIELAVPLLLDAPAVSMTTIPLHEANRLLDSWGHYLGPVRRPFGAQAWALIVDAPVAVAVSCSTVSATVRSGDRSWHRGELVELARLCSGQRWATRVMLRLWREVAAQAWPYWPVSAAAAYSQNARHDGSIYRFDGWKRASVNAGSSGGGTWSSQRPDGHAARGTKSLWLWEFTDRSDTKRTTP